MNHSKQAFSLVEVIISVAIIILLSVIAVTWYQSFTDKAKNSRMHGDLWTIKNALLSYYDANQTLPPPSGNLKFYNKNQWYEHNYEDPSTFWVSGFIANDTLPKAFLSEAPLDPKTNQNYAYGKTKKYNGFQLAWVLSEHNEPKSLLVSNWSLKDVADKTLPSELVKSYNGSAFIINNSIQAFPYNPYERKLTAFITDFTGTLLVNESQVTLSGAKNLTLIEGDTLHISPNGYVDLIFSDGSTSTLWDKDSASQLTLKNLTYLWDESIFTQIRLALDLGSFWTKAVKLSDASVFEVQTTSALAAVRGTIFGVKVWEGGHTNIVLIEGKVSAEKKVGDSFVPAVVSGVTNEAGEIEVTKWSDPKWVKVISPEKLASYTWATTSIPTAKVEEYLHANSPLWEEVVWDLIWCSEWLEKFNGKCVSFITTEPESPSEKTVFEWFREVLDRYPYREELKKWSPYASHAPNSDATSIWGWQQRLTTPVEGFLVDYYFDYVNKQEKYFNPDYICAGQRSFTHEGRCVENTLFSSDKNWKLVGYAPYDKDLDLHMRDNKALIASWSISSATNQCTEWVFSGLTNVLCTKSENGKFYQLTYPDMTTHTGIAYSGGTLQYNLQDLDVNFWSGFAVEATVRGEALLRSWESMMKLFRIWTKRIWLNPWKFRYWSNSDTHSITSDELTKTINAEGFYRIVIGKNIFKVLDYENNIVINEENNLAFWESLLFIGSNEEWREQWDDLIDDVKIYQYNSLNSEN